MISIFGVAAVALTACSPAPTSFAGTWGTDLEQCKRPQEEAEAPMVLTEKGYDQHEAHCTFNKVTSTGAGTWKIEAACTVEGNEQPHDMDLALAGNTLTVNGSKLIRCP
jgi:hypothetical protein